MAHRRRFTSGTDRRDKRARHGRCYERGAARATSATHSDQLRGADARGTARKGGSARKAGIAPLPRLCGLGKRSGLVGRNIQPLRATPSLCTQHTQTSRAGQTRAALRAKGALNEKPASRAAAETPRTGKAERTGRSNGTFARKVDTHTPNKSRARVRAHTRVSEQAHQMGGKSLQRWTAGLTKTSRRLKKKIEVEVEC